MKESIAALPISETDRNKIRSENSIRILEL
jgi:hypothetical protein